MPPLIGSTLTIAVCLSTLLGGAAIATAAEPPEAQTGGAAQPAAPPPDQSGAAAVSTSLTGDWGGFRTDLANNGLALGATETSEIFGVLGGGVSRGAIYEGRLELDLDLDLETITGIRDFVLHANAYQIHGRGLSRNYLGPNLLTLSNIEASRSTRLFDLWLQKGFFDSALSIRLGQIAADDEFITSQYAGSLINSTFGWPGLMGADLPSGGPAYPLATPGLRVKGALSQTFSIQAAIFNGNPASGAPGGDPEAGDPSGTNFSLNHDLFSIAEAAYAPTAGESYKAGFWYQSGLFADPRRDQAGLPLANPANPQNPMLHRGNFGAYAMTDRLLYQFPDSDQRTVGMFIRLGGAPADRNFVSFYVDAGVALTGPFPERQGDVVSLGVGRAQVSGAVAGFDRDQRRFTGTASAVRDAETVIELTYQMALASWWSVQPDVQYILGPTPGASRRPIQDAAILGMRTSVRF